MSAKINSETVKYIRNQWIDLDQIVGKETNPSRILLTFQNGDKIEFAWRDEAEREYLLRELAS
jgi:hypothetical protein